MSTFGYQMRFDLGAGFPVPDDQAPAPALDHRRVIWFLRGDTNIGWLNEHGISIWDEWADAAGDLRPVYGHQWRSWPTPDGRTVDQIAAVVESIRTNPDSRRHIVSAWNVADVDKMALPVPHDVPVLCRRRPTLLPALPALPPTSSSGCLQYRVLRPLLTHLVAQVTDLHGPGFVHTLGDAHLYVNHLDQARLQLSREPMALPTLRLNPARRALDEFEIEDIERSGTSPTPRSRPRSRYDAGRPHRRRGPQRGHRQRPGHPVDSAR